MIQSAVAQQRSVRMREGERRQLSGKGQPATETTLSSYSIRHSEQMGQRRTTHERLISKTASLTEGLVFVSKSWP